MEYSNPKIPEGINTSKTHPLKDFFILVGGVLGGIALCAIILGIFAENLALHIPFSTEQAIFKKLQTTNIKSNNSKTAIYLNRLTTQLVSHMDLAEDMNVTVNYIDDSAINAFANLGGHISIHQGLIESLPNENALAMVLAHEIAHIKNRDPIVALGRGVVVGLFLSTISGISTDHFTAGVINNTGSLAMLNFSRTQEQNADALAIATLATHYGHINGATSLFNVFIRSENRLNKVTPEFLNTHPLSQKRIQYVHSLAVKNNWNLKGDIVSLPQFITDKN